VREVIYRLRRDPRTARIPLIVLAGAGRLSDAKRLTDDFPWTIATPRPHTAEALREILTLARPWHAENVLPLDDRLERAGHLLEWLAGTGPQAAPLALEGEVLGAVHVPQLRERSLAVLAGLPTPASQQAMVDLASQRTVDVELRERAADAFRANTTRYGLLLGRREIVKLYDRYNAREGEPEPIQRLLGSLLDTIEGEAAGAPGQAPAHSAEPRSAR
jgi:hypothetical protein